MEFRRWLEAQEIPDAAIKVALPPKRQQTNYSCGATCFRSVCDYFKVGPDSEQDFIKLLGSDPDQGTTPENIVRAAKKLGLGVALKSNMTGNHLYTFLDKKIPVICAMQAHGEPEEYKKKESGHYAIVIGYDLKNFYFEDPSLDGDVRGVLPHKEFYRRWHDVDSHGHQCIRMGIAIWNNKVDPHKKTDKAKIID